MFRINSELLQANFIIACYVRPMYQYICNTFILLKNLFYTYFNNSLDKHKLVKSTHKYVDSLKIILCIFSPYINISENCSFALSNLVCKIFDRQINIVSIKKNCKNEIKIDLQSNQLKNKTIIFTLSIEIFRVLKFCNRS